MKRTHRVLWLGLVAIVAFGVWFAACNDDCNEDDDDDAADKQAPEIPHGPELDECLLCHAEAHDGVFAAGYTIPDTCLECHEYADGDDDSGDDDSGDDDSGDDDSGDDDDDDDDTSGPDIPGWHDVDGANNQCLTSGCHDGQHGGAYDGDTIPDKCLECHSQ